MGREFDVRELFNNYLHDKKTEEKKYREGPILYLRDVLKATGKLKVSSEEELSLKNFSEMLETMIKKFIEEQELRLKEQKKKEEERKHIKEQIMKTIQQGDNNVEELKFLILNNRDKIDQEILDSALIYAINEGLSNSVQVLLKENVNPSIDAEQIILCEKQGQSHRTVLKQLVQHPNIDIETPLIEAIKNGKEGLEIIALYLQSPKINQALWEKIKIESEKSKIVNIEKLLSIRLAIRLGEEKVVVEKLSQLSAKDLELVLNEQDNFGNTLLMEALNSGKIKIANYLLSQGAIPFIQNKSGKNALMRASELGEIGVVKQILATKNIKEQIDKSDQEGETALFKAINQGHIVVAMELARGLANPNIRNLHGNTALRKSISLGDLELFKTLLTHPSTQVSDLDHKYADATPLMQAIRNIRSDFAKLLIEKGANLFSINDEGDSALDLAQSCGLESIVLLIRNKIGKEKSSIEEERFIDNVNAVKSYGHVLGLSQNREIIAINQKWLKNEIDKLILENSIPINKPGSKEQVFVHTDFWFPVQAAKTLNTYINQYVERCLKNADSIDRNKIMDFKIIQEAYQKNQEFLEYDGNVSNENLLKSYQSNKPVVLTISWEKHSIGVILDKDKLIISNRGTSPFELADPLGGLPNAYTSIYQIPDRNKVDLNYIANLRPSGARKNSKEIMARIASLFGSREENTAILPKPLFTIDTKEQQHETCTLVNIKSAMNALLFLLEYERLTTNPKLSKIEIEDLAKKYARTVYKDFTKNMRDQATQELVESLNPKITTTTNPKLLDKELSFELIKREILSHHGQKKISIKDRSEKRGTELTRLIYILKNLSPEYKKRIFSELGELWLTILKIAQEEKNDELIKLISDNYDKTNKKNLTSDASLKKSSVPKAQEPDLELKSEGGLSPSMVTYYKAISSKIKENSLKVESLSMHESLPKPKDKDKDKDKERDKDKTKDDKFSSKK